jgi:hypothetical protein
MTILAVKKQYYTLFYPAWKAHARRIFICGVFDPTILLNIIA